MGNWYKIVNQAGMPVITIYGIIGDDDPENGITYTQFQAAFRELERTNTQCRICINSAGGSIIEGLPIYDMIVNSTMQVEILIEGTAASMAAILSQAGNKRLINANGFMMIHAASGGAYGNSNSLRNMADTIDALQARCKAILLERTGQSENIISGWLKPGIDTWLSAEQCLAFNLVDEIVQSQVSRVVIPVQNLSKRNQVDAYMYINSQIGAKSATPNKYGDIVDDLTNLSSMSDKIKGLLAPCLIDLSEGISYDNYGTPSGQKADYLTKLSSSVGVLINIDYTVQALKSALIQAK